MTDLPDRESDAGPDPDPCAGFECDQCDWQHTNKCFEEDDYEG